MTMCGMICLCKPQNKVSIMDVMATSAQLWQPRGATRLGIVELSLHMSMLLFCCNKYGIALFVWKKYQRQIMTLALKFRLNVMKKSPRVYKGGHFNQNTHLTEGDGPSHPHTKSSVSQDEKRLRRLKRKRKIYFPISNQIWSISVLASFFCVKFCLFRVIIFQSLFFQKPLFSTI